MTYNLMNLISEGIGQVQAQLSVTYLPDTLFSGSTTSVVEGSVLWLYCEVNSTSTSLSVSWSKDGGSLVQDVPHIRLRISTSSSSTTLLLVVDNVVSSDAGVYQCSAKNGLVISAGSSISLSGYYMTIIKINVLYYGDIKIAILLFDNFLGTAHNKCIAIYDIFG